MSFRDVLEYRAADDVRIVFALADLEPSASTIYSRPFGATEWGWYSGEFYFDTDYRASHTHAKEQAHA